MGRVTKREGLSIQEKRRIVRDAEAVGVSTAARRANVTRASVYRWRRTINGAGWEKLPPPTREGTPLLANRVSPEIEAATIGLALNEPHLGQVRAATELRRRGFSISPAGVRNIWVRKGLGTMDERAAAAGTTIAAGVEINHGEAATLRAEIARLSAAVGQIQTQLTHFVAVEERRERARRSHVERQHTAPCKQSSSAPVGDGILRRLFGDAIPEQVSPASVVEPPVPSAPSAERGPGILTRLFGGHVPSEALLKIAGSPDFGIS